MIISLDFMGFDGILWDFKGDSMTHVMGVFEHYD